MTVPQIGKIEGVSNPTIYQWLRNPDRYSPFIDEIAIDRALNGDRKVMSNFTTWELREFWLRIWDEAQRERRNYGESDQPLMAYARIAGFYNMPMSKVKDMAYQTHKRFPRE